MIYDIKYIRRNLKLLDISIECSYIPDNLKIIVPLSGGKDSQACLKLARQRYSSDEVIAVFCDTKFEHDITYKHIQKTVKRYGVELVVLNAGSVHEQCIKRGRFPGGGARHCTSDLKIRPSNFFYKFLSEQSNSLLEVWLGMRAGESSERRERYRNVIAEDLYDPNDILPSFRKYLSKNWLFFKLPILEWSEEGVYDFLGKEKNPLYDKGFSRVGCFPCLMSGDKWKIKAFEFDSVGAKHYKIALDIQEKTGAKLMRSKKLGEYKCSVDSSGCAFCEI